MDAYLSLSFSFRNIFVRPQLLNCRPKYLTTISIVRDTYIISFFNHVVLMSTFPRVYYIFSRVEGYTTTLNGLHSSLNGCLESSKMPY